jgi:hypothetical protein
MPEDKYIKYMKNVGGRISIGKFHDDWDPIGGRLLQNMLNKGEVVRDGFDIVLVEKPNAST